MCGNAMNYKDNTMKLKLTILVLLLATLLACSNNRQTTNTPEATAAPTEQTDTPATAETTETGGGEAPEAPVETTKGDDGDLTEAEEAEVQAVLDELINPPASAIPAPVDLQGAEAAEIFGEAEYVRLLTFEGLNVPLCLQGNRVAEGAFLNGAVFMAECRDVTGQLWRATREDSGYYTLQTLALEAENKCLEGNVRSDGSALGGAAFLDNCADVSGQNWKFVDRGDGTYRMQTQFLEAENLCFDGNIVDPRSVLQGASYMNDCAEVPGQIWIIEPVFDTADAVEAQPVDVIDTRIIEPIVIPEEENTFLFQIGAADGLCLEGSATPAGEPAQAAVALVACNEDPALLWQFVTTPDPAYYTLQTLASQDALKCLDGNVDMAGALFDGAPFINDCSGAATQNWRIIITADESPRIQSEASLAGNKCLTITADNLVTMETCQVDGGQAWEISQTAVPVAFVPEGGPRHVAPDDLLAAAASLTGEEVSAPLDDANVRSVDVTSAPAATIDNTGVYYRLQTLFLEDQNKCLEGGDGVGGAAFMDDCQNVSGQLWKIVPTDGPYYRLQTLFQEGENKCFEGNRLAAESVFEGGAFMNECEDVTGQLWKFIESEVEGYYRLQTEFLEGENQCLEGNRLAPESVLAGRSFMDNCQNVTGQLWKLVPTDTAVSDTGDDTSGDSSDNGADLASLCADVPASTDTDVMVRFANTNDQTLYLYGSNANNQLEQVAVIEPGAFHDQPTAQYAYWQIFDTEIDGLDEMERQTHLWTAYSVTEAATQCADLYSGISIADGADACTDIAALPNADVTVRFVNSSGSFQYVFLGDANGPQAQRVVNLRPGAYHNQPAAEGEAYQVYNQSRPWEADDPGVYQTGFHMTTAEATQCVTLGAQP
jgi:hypothetical protein